MWGAPRSQQPFAFTLASPSSHKQQPPALVFITFFALSSSSPSSSQRGGVELAFLSCQNRHGGPTSSAQGSQRAALTAHCLLISSRLPALPAPLGREEGRGAGEGSCPCSLPSPCSERLLPIWNGTTTVKAGRLGARRDSPQSSWPVQMTELLSRKTWPFSQGQAASRASG